MRIKSKRTTGQDFCAFNFGSLGISGSWAAPDDQRQVRNKNTGSYSRRISESGGDKHLSTREAAENLKKACIPISPECRRELAQRDFP